LAENNLVMRKFSSREIINATFANFLVSRLDGF